MRSIGEKNDIECGLAWAVMACGVPYGRALRPVSAAQREAGLSVPGMSARLDALSGRPWTVWNPRPRPPVAEYRRWPDGPCVALVRREDRARSHYVGVNDGLVHNPEHVRPRPLASCPRRHWVLIRLFARA